MLTILLELATALPETWIRQVLERRRGAPAKKNELEQQRQTLSAPSSFPFRRSKQRDRAGSTPDPWVNVSLADFRFLTADRPGRSSGPTRTRVEGQPDFVGDSVRGQLRLYQELDLLTEKVNRVLAVLAPPARRQPPRRRRRARSSSPGIRSTPRDARSLASRQTRSRLRAPPFAKRSCARRRDLAAPSASPARRAAATSSFTKSARSSASRRRCTWRCPRSSTSRSPSRPQAATGFDVSGPSRIASRRRRFSPAASRSPGWLQHRRILLDLAAEQSLDAQRSARRRSTEPDVLALWNGKQGDGPGGTADMIEIARARGAETRVLDTNAVFGAGSQAGRRDDTSTRLRPTGCSRSTAAASAA